MRNRGFTLVEALIVTIITTILIGIFTAAVLQTYLIFQVSDITSELQNNARIGTEKMLLDLRRVTNDSGSPNRILIAPDPFMPGSDSITYWLPSWVGGVVSWSNPITISLRQAVPDVHPQQLIRNDGVNPIEVLTNNVLSINFINDAVNPSLYDDELRIVMTLQKTDKGRTYTSTSFTTVSMRN